MVIELVACSEMHVYIVQLPGSGWETRFVPVEAMSDVVAEEAAGEKRKRDGGSEYELKTIRKTFDANKNTQEAKVFFSFTGKTPAVIALRRQFLQEFQEKGFGFVEGTRWTQNLSKEEHVAEEEYMSAAQILKAECKDAAATQAKIDFALAQGEGNCMPGQGKGYKDASRGDVLVYRYQKNAKTLNTHSRIEGHGTENKTGQIAMSNVPVPSAGSSASAGTLSSALCDGSSGTRTPVGDQPFETPERAGKPAAEAASEAKEEGPLDKVEKASVEDLKRKAQCICDQMVGNTLLNGFSTELTVAMDAVKAVQHPKSNYRCVRNLATIVDLSERVLKVVEPDATV